MKVFQIGFNKCGTKSLYTFFKQNGHRSIHNNKSIEEYTLKSNHAKGKLLCDGADGIILWSDIRYVQRNFSILANQYPDSKFIFNVRNFDNWLQSKQRQTNRPFAKYDKYNREYIDKYDIKILFKEYWKAYWIIHTTDIEEYFVGVQSKRLLVFDIEKDTGEKIADFLPELKFHNLKFPHRNIGSSKRTKQII